MKTSFCPFFRFLSPTALSAACLLVLTLPQTTGAKDHDDDKHGHDSKHRKTHHDDHDRAIYLSHPHTGFTLSLGNGYAGRGYYYGPPNSPYYYERPEVRYYATREAAPREYYTRQASHTNPADAAVQRALANRGYYQGAIDGEIGPQSRRAIGHYQESHGMRVTGYIDSSLLQSLGLQ